MVFLRWMLGAPLAAGVTLTLFFLMAGLIAQNDPELHEERAAPDIKILAARELPKTEPPPPRPNKVEQKQPDIEIPPVSSRPRPAGLKAPPRAIRSDSKPARMGGFASPVIRHAPLYPEGCRSRGVEGDVLVQFDVTPEGAVTNVVIVQSPDRCFDRTVRRAVARWKYPPATQNGRSVMRYGVVERFTFELTE